MTTASPPITLEHIRQMVEHIQANSSDDEAAHIEEDALWEAALTAIADGTFVGKEAKEAAALALRTKNIDFVRYYGVTHCRWYVNNKI